MVRSWAWVSEPTTSAKGIYLHEEGILKASEGSRQRALHYQGIALVTMATVAWASGGLFTRLLPFDMWTIIFWRGVFGTLFVGAYTLWRLGGELPAAIRRMGPMGILVTLCSTSAITVFVPAFQMTSVANAFTIYASVPFMTAAVA